MADNYLEKKMEALREVRPKVVRNNPSLESLLKKNRSHRGYDASVKLPVKTLKELIAAATLCPSGMNAQSLRFRPVSSEEVHKIHPLVKLGAALPDEHLPHPGEEPQGYIVICSARPEDRVVDIDLGIAAQSILLNAVSRGLNGIVILNFNPEAVQQALDLPLRPLCIIGLGKGIERIFLLPVHQGDSLTYFRKEGVHYVPKLTVEDLLI